MHILFEINENTKRYNKNKTKSNQSNIFQKHSETNYEYIIDANR